MSLYKVTDLNMQTVWINPQAVSAVVIPSLLDPNGAKSQILIGPVGIVVSESEARGLLNLLHIVNETPNGDHS